MPYIFVASQFGDVVNQLEILFMVGGFRVVCNLNTLVIDRLILGYIFIENPNYLLYEAYFHIFSSHGKKETLLSFIVHENLYISFAY